MGRQFGKGMLSVTYLIMLFVGLTSCRSNNGAAGKYNLKPLTLTRDLRISANNPNVLIGGFGSMVVDNNGNIYAVDFRKEKIHIFGPNGSYLDSLGRKGKGPGEFTNLTSIHLSGDTLFATDSGISPLRLTMYNIRNHSFIGSYDIPKIKGKKGFFSFPSQVFPAGNDRFEVVYRGVIFFLSNKTPNHVTIVLTKAKLKGIEDTLAVPPSNHVLFYHIIPVSGNRFLSSPLIKSGSDGTFYAAVTDSMHITGYNESGRVIKTFRADFTSPVLKMAQIDSIRNTRYKKISSEVNKALSHITIPKRWPAIQNFLVDDLGRCWVELMDPGKPKQTWWVFNASGKPEWKFRLPTDINLYVVKKGEVYGIETSNDGLPAIVRYKINKTDLGNG